jgi:hypothetical protein
MRSINLNRLDKSLSANMKSYEVEYEKFDYHFKKDTVHGFDYIVAFNEDDARARAIFKHGDGLDILSISGDI